MYQVRLMKYYLVKFYSNERQNQIGVLAERNVTFKSLSQDNCVLIQYYRDTGRLPCESSSKFSKVGATPVHALLEIYVMVGVGGAPTVEETITNTMNTFVSMLT